VIESYSIRRFKRDRACGPEGSSQQFTIASLNPPGGIACSAAGFETSNVICTLN